MSRESVRRTATVLVAVLVAVASVASAQSDRPRSETGRRKPAPPPVKPTPELTPAERGMGQTRWFAGLGAGIVGGGDLWHAETVSGAPLPWISTTPFTSARFNATLSNNGGLGLFVGRRLDERWALRADLSSSRMDIGAEALQGQQAAVFLYDRLTTTTVSLAAEVRLVRLASYPFASLGAIWNHMSAAREDALDQNQLGFQVGLGYLHNVSPGFSIRAEARFSRSGFELGDFVPRSDFNTQPVLELEGADRLNLFSILLAAQMNL